VSAFGRFQSRFEATSTGGKQDSPTPKRRLVHENESGDESPHSKDLPECREPDQLASRYRDSQVHDQRNER